MLVLLLLGAVLPHAAEAQLRRTAGGSPHAESISAPVAVQVETGDDAEGFCKTGDNQSLDVRGLAAFYCSESAWVKTPLTAAHRSAYPVFYGGVPAAWLGVWAVRGTDDFTDAYRLTLTQGATFVSVVALKRLFGRPRPFMTHPGVTSRSASYGRSINDGQFASLPSGHASLSVALATSWSLSHPRWYVIGPAAVWAGGVSLSRLYLGVHYPSDILLGALLGAGIATGIHLLRDAITPSAITPDDPAAVEATGPSVTLLQFRF